MRTSLAFALLLAAIALPAQAQQVWVDYDSTATFAQFESFQFKEAEEDLRDYSMNLHRQVVQDIKNYILEGGVEQVDSDPDIYVTYYTADRGELRLSLTDMEYAYGPNTQAAVMPGGVGSRTPDFFRFNQGTLIIDAWEADTKRLIWRGIATTAVPQKPERQAKKLTKAVKKIMKQWEELQGGYLRALRKAQAEDGS